MASAATMLKYSQSSYLPGKQTDFNLKMPSHQNMKYQGDKTVLRTFYLHNGISYTGKMTSLYWIRPQILALEPRENLAWGHAAGIHVVPTPPHATEWAAPQL